MKTSTKTLVASELSDHLEPLWRFAMRLCRDEQVATDLVQRTCVRALEKNRDYHSQNKLISWLFRIMHNLWINELRAQQVRHQYAQHTLALVEEAEAASENSLDNQLLLEQVLSAVDQLPETQRVTMLLNCVEGFSYQEVADILDIPIGTVMSRIARARLAIGEKFSTANDETPSQHSPKHDKPRMKLSPSKGRTIQ